MTVNRFPLSRRDPAWKEKLSSGSEELGFHVHQLESGLSAGVELLTLNCGGLSVDLIPTRGMGIWQARNGETRFGWESPVQGPVHPSFVPLADPSGFGWLDGFDELIVRCGLVSNGAPDFEPNGQLKLPLHGRIANLPAQDVVVEIDEAAGTISATGVVLESRFHFHRWQLKSTVTLTHDSDEIQIVDEVTNLSERPGSFQLLYHCNFGPPLLESGSKFFAPVKKVAPRDTRAAEGIGEWNEVFGAEPDYTEQVYFCDLETDDHGETVTMLTNQAQTLGAGLRHATDNLPCFSLWKNTVGLADGYVVGLEPATNFPNPRSFEEQHGRVVEMSHNQTTEFRLAVGLHVGPESVASTRQKIESTSSAEPEICKQPLSDWSA